MYEILVQICVKSLPEYFGTMFAFNNELYQIEIRGQNQLHLFPTRTVSARNVLRHHIPDLLQEYPRAMTQRAKTHSIESFVSLLKAYIIESYSYVCTDMNCYSCGRNVLNVCTSIGCIIFSHSYLHVTHDEISVCLAIWLIWWTNIFVIKMINTPGHVLSPGWPLRKRSGLTLIEVSQHAYSSYQAFSLPFIILPCYSCNLM